jgi:PAS domain S-box-containing protein
MAVTRKDHARNNRTPVRTIRDRLHEAEATLEAIRTGQVDALVVSGPRGERTLTIEGAAHPYFVLLDAMSDGAALLELDGTILFGNRSLGDIAGKAVGKLRGSKLQRLVAPADRSSFEESLRAQSMQNIAREYSFVTARGSATPVAITLSDLPLGISSRGASRDGTTVLMAIITDVSYRKATDATRAGLLERLISAEDDERRRIARELHDETGQSLTALQVGLRTIADMDVHPDVRTTALRLRDIAAQTVDDLGRLARGLHPAVLDDKGLAAAARRYVGDYVRSFGTAIEFTAGDLDSPPLASMPAATMYRILQEALTNVARHARASKIVVELARNESTLELVVRDDGVGFRVSAQHETAGLGLRGMRERVTLLGGSIRIDSAPRKGTVVRARIPAGTSRPLPPAKAPPARRRTGVHKES